MTLATVRQLLETRLVAIDPALLTQWENADALNNVASDTPYQVVHLLNADPSNPEINGPFFIDRGYMNVALRYPAGKGVKDIDERAQLIRDTFPYALSLTANGITVTINKTPTRSPGLEDGGRYQVAVKIFFTANNG